MCVCHIPVRHTLHTHGALTHRQTPVSGVDKVRVIERDEARGTAKSLQVGGWVGRYCTAVHSPADTSGWGSLWDTPHVRIQYVSYREGCLCYYTHSVPCEIRHTYTVFASRWICTHTALPVRYVYSASCVYLTAGGPLVLPQTRLDARRQAVDAQYQEQVRRMMAACQIKVRVGRTGLPVCEVRTV